MLGLDILIATPGRLLDLIGDNRIGFDQLEVFILDEADTMLDMGFLKDVKTIISKLPIEKQTLLFSATMPKDIEKLATNLLKSPVRVEIKEEYSTLQRVEQKLCCVEKANKTYLLLSLLENPDIKSALVFVKTKFGADRIVELLEKSDITCAAIHSNKTQGVRERAINEFRDGDTRVLVATDVAARGIDISHISHVINMNLPEDPRNYIHRIGRTARAGRGGSAISFCTQHELPMLKNIENLIKEKIPVDLEQPFHKDVTLESKKNVSKKKSRQSKRK
jgi:ATP-dependent RNA helicase RhlE